MVLNLRKVDYNANCMTEVLFKNKGITCFLRRSSRVKHLRLQIDGNLKMTLVAPKRMPKFLINSFVVSHQGWIDKQVMKIQKQKADHPSHQYKGGEIFYYFGEKVFLRILPHKLKRPKVKVTGDELKVYLYKEISNDKAVSEIKKAVEHFYKLKANEVVHDRLQHFNEHYGFRYNRVTLRNQKSRWGSCSRLKNLNFNWRLIMAPIEVIDYVVVHELCHLKQMNHSPKFWALVSENIPRHKECRKWLREKHYLLSV